MASEIEKTNLEAHVEIDDRNHLELQNQIDYLKETVDRLAKELDEIGDALTESNDSRHKQMITIAGTVIGVLFSALVGTLTQLLK